ncbi:heme NO-binding domain-containing protein [Candidatus Magnetaquicoccus inordinatus]|uniref:heme NO-binding domain-containing protein n=1 Tax=Candidatus Magnetaquicoccus inordinatus TaxID=2496818 RepID=UPI00102CC3A0|nr:heme NO-binding domain-containing protein [Candidatus Magnetaquicoccus inordinatus]
MHGIILLALEDYQLLHGGADSWREVWQLANRQQQPLAADRLYPDQLAQDLLHAAARQQKIPFNAFLEAFGRHLSVGLLSLGRTMGLLRPEWRTLDILEHLNKEIFAHFHFPEGVGKTPQIRAYRLKYGEVSAVYPSERKWCGLFKGIVLGCAQHFHETIRIQERLCMWDGAPLCRLSILLLDPTLQQQVEIGREFQMVHDRIQEIRFFNQFEGIPLVHPGLVLRYSQQEVMVQIHPQSLCAMQEEGVTYLALPHLPLGLKAEVKQLQWQQGTALLHNIIPTDGPIGRRVAQRVASNSSVMVAFQIEQQTFRGWLANLSITGIAIVLRSDPQLKEISPYTPIQMQFALPASTLDPADDSAESDYPLQCDGNILHIDERDGRHRIRILFRPLSVNDTRRLVAYYQEREQSALHALQTKIAITRKQLFDL